jgi:exo-beta-1,3-glucanase (GH17 family)
MKKSLYVFAALATIIAGCSGGYNSGSVSENLPNADFSFSDLRLNLSSINQVGVYKNPSRPLGRKQSSVVNSTTQTDSYLVGYNAQ